MRPSLGKKVYCIYENSISLVEVYAIGKESFIISTFGPDTFSDSWEHYFEDYGKTWFSSLAKAKKQLIKNIQEVYPDDKVKVVQHGKDYWEAE